MSNNKTPQVICGIDPGLSGAISFYNPQRDFLAVHDIPTHTVPSGKKTKRDPDYAQIASLIEEKSEFIEHVYIEQVGAMPGQGVTSMFNFGKVYGVLIGVVAATMLPMTFISPMKWKRALGVPANKDGARARASQLMPKHGNNWLLKKHDGRAEAALIALYGSRITQLPKVEDLLG